MYKWGGRLFQQQKGGAIGLRATGSLARITMDIWADMFIAKMKDLGIPLHFITKYVDDIVVIMRSIGKGWHYCKNSRKLIYQENGPLTDLADDRMGVCLC